MLVTFWYSGAAQEEPGAAQEEPRATQEEPEAPQEEPEAPQEEPGAAQESVLCTRVRKRRCFCGCVFLAYVVLCATIVRTLHTCTQTELILRFCVFLCFL